MRCFTGFRVCLALIAVLTGCQPSWPERFPVGTRLYQRTDHRYFGRVVGFDAAHDFRNGSAPEPSVLIEQAEGGGKIWGACATCADSLQVEKP